MGAAVSAAGGNNALAGGLSAGGAEAAAPIISQYLYGEKDSSKLNAEQKQTLSTLTSLLGASTGAAVGNTTADTVSGSLSANSAVENNHSVSKSIDNSAEGCGQFTCAIYAGGKAIYEAGTLGFASWHDDWRDKYDNGEITEEEYWRIGVAGGGAIALTNWYGGKWIGDAGSAVISKLAPTIKLDWSTGWSIRGKQWETELSKVLPEGYIDLNKYKSNFKTFDFYNPNTKTAVSAKSIDTVSSFNGKDGLVSLERQIKGYVDDTLKFNMEKSVKNGYELNKKDIQHREVHIAIPQGTSIDKMKSINNAVNYGKTKGVKVIITETKSR